MKKLIYQLGVLFLSLCLPALYCYAECNQLSWARGLAIYIIVFDVITIIPSIITCLFLTKQKNSMSAYSKNLFVIQSCIVMSLYFLAGNQIIFYFSIIKSLLGSRLISY